MYTNIPRFINLYGDYNDESKELTLSWDENELFKFTDIYARYSNNTDFEKISSVTNNEYKVSEEVISTNVDYKIIAHTKFGETVNSIILSFEKNDNELIESNIDSDNDGISEGYEITIGTNPNKSDTDNDGLTDDYEVNILKSNPLIADIETDSDNDGLSDLKEQQFGTNPKLKDTDFDGIIDSKDSEPLKTDVNSNKSTDYNISPVIGVFDLDTRYVDEKGNKYEVIYNYLTGKTSYLSDSTNTTNYIYDKNNNLSAVIEHADGKYAVNTFVYEDDNLTSITHNGFQYEFNYDNDSNLISSNVAGKKLLSNTYEDDCITEENYGNGLNVKYDYDSDGNVISQSDSIGNKYNWTYDKEGNIINYKEKDIENNYIYDTNGDLISLKSSNGFNIIYNNYNNNSNSTTYENHNESKSQSVTYTIQDESSDEPSKVEINLISNGKYIDIIDSQNNEDRSIYSNNQKILFSKINKNNFGIDNIEYQDGRKIYYTYDDLGNIIAISDGTNVISDYEYDGFGQIVRENNKASNTTVIYTYDIAGNILKSETYEYSSDTPTNKISEKIYTYDDSNWKDLLTSFNNQKITYDEIGNPLSYRNNINLIWEGRNLIGFKNNINNVTYTYNSDGIRTSKTIDNIKTTYQLEDSKIISETTNGNIKWYIYDDSNNILGFQYNGKIYYFEKNAFGDITNIYDENGNSICGYSYDAWGNITEIAGDEAIANENPFRYRSYYYDNESGFYYLQSRYYDSATGRFLNTDKSQMLDEFNTGIFKYANNNPITNIDETGEYSYSYNRQNAIKYARRYHKIYNKKYIKFNNDCANFVSQCINAGKIKQTNNGRKSFWSWYYINRKNYSYSWIRVIQQRTFINIMCKRKSYIVNYNSRKQINSIKNNIKIGDIIYFDFNSDGKYDHATMISAITSNDILYTAHTNSKFNASLKYNMSKKCKVEIISLYTIQRKWAW